MSIRSTIFAAAATITMVVAGTAHAAKPVAVIAINSINNLFEDADFIGGLAGQPNVSAQFQPMVQGFTPGLDHSRPIGIIVQMENDIPSGAICVPVTNLQQLLAVLKNFGVLSEEKENGIIEISAQGQTLVAKEVNGWAFISQLPQMLEGLPENPGEFFGELTDEYDLGISLHVQNIPEAFKQMALSQLQAGMEAGMQQLEEETDEQFQARKELTDLQVKELRRAVQEIDKLTFGIAVDSQGQRALLDMSYTAIAGSKLADQIALNNNPKTDYAGFLQPDAAMMMSFASKISDDDIAQMEQVFDAVRKQVSTAINQEVDDLSDTDREVVISAIDDFMLALQATVPAGKMDGGAVLNLSPESLSFVGGGFVGDPAKVEDGFKKLIKMAQEKEPQFPQVNWNATSHGNVQFHTLQIPIPADGGQDEENARKLFGDTIDVALGIGKDSVYLGVGRDSVAAVKGIIDDSATSPQKPVAPMEITFSLGTIMETIVAFMDDDEHEKPMFEAIAAMLTSEASGRDHIRMVVQPIENGARFRIEAEEGVLRAIGEVTKASQMQAAGAGGF